MPQSNLRRFSGDFLVDAPGAVVGAVGADRKEYLFPTVQNAIGVSAQPTMGAQNANAVAITGGTINGATIGQTTPAAVKTSNLQATYTDSTGTPGNVTNNSPRGRVAVAAAASTVVVTNSLVAATSAVKCQLRAIDGAATAIQTVSTAAGSFTITMNAATTGTAAQIDFMVIN